MADLRLLKDFLENQEQARELMEKKIDELRSRIVALFDLGLKAQQEKDKLKLERDEARLMVLRLVVSTYRVGWEEGENEEEVLSEARDKLANWDLDLVNNKERCEELLGYELEVW